MANEYKLVNVETDKFAGSKTFRLKKQWEIYKKNDTKLTMFISHEQGNKFVKIMINYYAKDWIFLRNGDLKIKGDSHVISSSPAAQNSEVVTESNVINNDKKVKVTENAIYLLAVADLLKLLESNKLEIRISGSKASIDIDLKEIITYYLKGFYHEIIDNSMFKSEYEQVLVYDAEEKKANFLGVGIGCVVPVILFLMVAYGAFGDYKGDGRGWKAGIPFIIAIIGLIIYMVLMFKANKKAFNKQVD